MSDTIEEKLEYIGLNLNKIPKFLKEFTPLDFRTSKIKEDNKHIVYKYIPINKIQILITPKNRLDDIEEKYAKAAPIIAYLDPKTQEDIERHAKFLSMVKQVSVEEIEDAVKEQKKLDKKIPFEIKYDKSYEWQIYYSENSNQYFMMVPSEDYEYAKLFLLLKMQIEFSKSKAKKVPQIFVPVNYVDYSETILKKSEIKDIENYLWLFTKDWTNIYEVYDKEGNMSLQIVGKTNVYENIKSKYKITLSTKDEAIAFYQYLKALFILQTELSMHYKFKTQINSKSELEFYYNNTKIKYDNLSKFIEDEYIKLQKQEEKNKKQIQKQQEELTKLKELAKQKENEYLDKQRQIALYLECKKTFFGKVKYFFKHKKTLTKTTNKNTKNDIVDIVGVGVPDDPYTSTTNQNDKPYYTIEDLVTLYYIADKTTKQLNNTNLDIDALNNKITNLELKVKNACLYIEEIDKHKKSIFEFWKFANKDEQKALEVGSGENKNSKKQIKKVFKYEFDFEDLALQMDKKQRIKLSKVEQDSVYIATTNLIDTINNIDIAESSLENLKKQQDENIKVYNFQEFDIFGNMQENIAKTKNLGNQKHRENKKDALKILGITKNTTLEEYINKINEIKNNLNESFKKIKSKYDMSIYVVSDTDEILKNEYCKYYINLEDALKSSNLNSKEIKVCKLNLLENMPLIYCSNIIFYDNFNKTLPEGMHEEETVLLKNTMYEFEQSQKQEFKTNMYFENEETTKVRKVIVNEYELKLCKENK